MQRNPTQGQRHPRHDAERDAAKPIDGRSHDADDDDELEKPENVPSLLTARELQSREPWVPGEGLVDDDDDEGGERHAAASSSGSRGEPPITDGNPARGKRGLPGNQADDLLKGRKGR